VLSRRFEPSGCAQGKAPSVAAVRTQGETSGVKTNSSSLSGRSGNVWTGGRSHDHLAEQPGAGVQGTGQVCRGRAALPALPGHPGYL